ncbi:pyridoxamine 5'-phosphate oxidase family protein [Sneathiella sp.]|uniref:pyridoxamine 5'-phosphate oxidase family protein n=1 Tax=Sneathiella sp. TaxID=1964365 RepID=UPI0035641613
MSSAEHKQKIWNFIKDIKVGMLVTRDDDDLRARPMHLVQKDYDDTIWFFTKFSAEKAFEIKDEHNVCIAFCNHNDGVHVSLSGTARLSQDPVLITRFWNPFVAAWFDGEDDPEVALLEIRIYKGEHWEAEKNKVFQLYEIAKAGMSGGEPDIGKSEKFG